VRNGEDRRNEPGELVKSSMRFVVSGFMKSGGSVWQWRRNIRAGRTVLLSNQVNAAVCSPLRSMQIRKVKTPAVLMLETRRHRTRLFFRFNRRPISHLWTSRIDPVSQDRMMRSKNCKSPANGKNLSKCLFDRFCTFGCVRNSLKRQIKKAPQVGLEPTTLRLQPDRIIIALFCRALLQVASLCFRAGNKRT
jgi:hypothetical protein